MVCGLKIEGLGGFDLCYAGDGVGFGDLDGLLLL